jgi:uncharacterized protein YaiE (UPF0345 family)
LLFVFRLCFLVSTLPSRGIILALGASNLPKKRKEKIIYAFDQKSSVGILFCNAFFILNAANASAFADDYTPEVTARVARISFVSGDVQIKRADQTDWERATQNLPVVEGDEIATDSNSRLEIQFAAKAICGFRKTLT